MAWSTSTRSARYPADWKKRRVKVLERDGYRCRIRGPHCTVAATQVDHVKHGDDHSYLNLQACCDACHKAKTAEESQAARGVGAARKRPAENHPGILR